MLSLNGREKRFRYSVSRCDRANNVVYGCHNVIMDVVLRDVKDVITSHKLTQTVTTHG